MKNPSAGQRRWIANVAQWGAENCGEVYGVDFLDGVVYSDDKLMGCIFKLDKELERA